MTLAEVITNSLSFNGDLTLFAKRIDGNLTTSSEAVLLELTEEEHEMDVTDIASKRCPGFSYCMPMDMIQEMMTDLNKLDEDELEDRIYRVIYYIEFDA